MSTYNRQLDLEEPTIKETQSPKNPTARASRMYFVCGVKGSMARSKNKAQMPNIPYDIVVDVLLRLPVKSLIRLRCVCKSWRSLISDPQFVNNHLNLAITDINVGCRRVLLPTLPLLQSIDYVEAQYSGVDVFTELDYPKNFRKIFLSKSCNGLVCMVVDSNNIILCNPCTRISRVLPKPDCYDSPRNHLDGIMAYGLGYDSSVDDYKVVLISRPVNTGELQVEVFSLRTKSWRKIYDNDSDRDTHPAVTYFRRYGVFFYADRGGGTFLDGALHWIGRTWIGRTSYWAIITFNVVAEKFHEPLPLPPPTQDNTCNPYNCRLNVSGEGLLVVHCGCTLAEHEIWVMKEYGVKESWTKLFTVRHERGFGGNFLPVCFSKNGEFLVDVDGCCLRMYNPEDGNFRDLHVQEKGKRHTGSTYNEPTTYVESLVSPYGYGGNNWHSATHSK